MVTPEDTPEPGPASQPAAEPRSDEDTSTVPAAEVLEPAEDEMVSEPLKLVRIASMVQILLNEVRSIELDQQARDRLQEVHHRTVDELREIMSDELRTEMDKVLVPLSEGASESELRLAQAQLAGWLEGLFHGIRASMWGQQMAQQRLLASQAQALQGLDQRASENTTGGMYL
ncbi:MAG: bacterial proteasome activator family protein [Acidimicrobiia bacterium]|nr:bacterial proteasome activator family protein [Acidimicrobiia bacterium]NNL48528.1 DUF2587 domain-containing protein [Acidimicrobiia bacterium]